MEKKVLLVKLEKQGLKVHKANPELPAHKEFLAHLEKSALWDRKEKLAQLGKPGPLDPKGLKVKLAPKEIRDHLDLLLTEKEVIPLRQACIYLS